VVVRVDLHGVHANRANDVGQSYRATVEDGFAQGGPMADERSHEFTRALYGWITHTDFASTDPVATRDWCAEVLGWTFQPAFPTPNGEYHLFAYSDAGGGGIRQTAADERPGSTPTVHVEDAQAAFDAALAAGAEAVSPPTKIMDGVCVAMVRAPGGVLIGFSGPTS
jgi:predicted enzyme related to lactoylglutathione lyase